jgi:outer membrane protein assembly factor BamE (lipoprotein component of BamABCDE complex)
MKTPNKMPIIIVFIGLISGSCITTNKPGSSKVITIQEIEQIHLGAYADQVLQILGEPAEKEEVRDKNRHYVVWNYKIHSEESQRASLSLDPKAHTVLDKLVVPREDEEESKLSYLLKKKYSQHKFQQITFPQCGRDFVSDEAMMVDSDRGIWIRYRKKSDYVVGIGWGPPEKTRQDIEAIRNCKAF